MITVGGIATKPRYVDGALHAREILDLTVSVDHAVVDGAPAAAPSLRMAPQSPTGSLGHAQFGEAWAVWGVIVRVVTGSVHSFTSGMSSRCSST